MVWLTGPVEWQIGHLYLYKMGQVTRPLSSFEGQKISEGYFGILNSTQKTNETYS